MTNLIIIGVNFILARSKRQLYSVLKVFVNGLVTNSELSKGHLVKYEGRQIIVCVLLQ